jgi:hypothetical protein
VPRNSKVWTRGAPGAPEPSRQITRQPILASATERHVSVLELATRPVIVASSTPGRGSVDLVTSIASTDVAASVDEDLPVVSCAADGVVWRRPPATNE